MPLNSMPQTLHLKPLNPETQTSTPDLLPSHTAAEKKSLPRRAQGTITCPSLGVYDGIILRVFIFQGCFFLREGEQRE